MNAVIWNAARCPKFQRYRQTSGEVIGSLRALTFSQLTVVNSTTAEVKCTEIKLFSQLSSQLGFASNLFTIWTEKSKLKQGYCGGPGGDGHKLPGYHLDQTCTPDDIYIPLPLHVVKEIRRVLLLCTCYTILLPYYMWW